MKAAMTGIERMSPHAVTDDIHLSRISTSDIACGVRRKLRREAALRGQ